MKILTEMYELYNEVIKHTKIGNHSFDTNKFIEDGKHKKQIVKTIIIFTDNIWTNIYNINTLMTMSKDSKIFSNNKNNIKSININKLYSNKNYDLYSHLLNFLLLHLLCNKGSKGNYEEIINWLNDLNINIINKLIKVFSDGINNIM